MALPIRVSADEINCLIHSYFQDAGLQHSAFSLRKEGNLDQSPYFTKHIPRGELIELLTKALLYIEVESHWQDNLLAKNCKAGFSLLDSHTCSPEPVSVTAVDLHATSIEGQKDTLRLSEARVDTAAKRKPSPPIGDNRAEKRPRTDPVDQDTDTAVQEYPKKTISRSDSSTVTVKKPKKRPRFEHRFLSGHASEVFVCAWNPARPDLLASGSKDAVVNFWDFSSGSGVSGSSDEYASCSRTLLTTSDQGDLTALDWNFDGSLLAVGCYDSILRICEASGRIFFSHPQHQKGPIFSVRFSKCGRWLLTASLDGTTCVWDVEGKALHSQYHFHSDCCLDIEWLGEDIFASCGADNRIYIIRLGDKKPTATLEEHEDEVNQIRCNPSRTRLASCSDDRTARVWEIQHLTAGTLDPGDFISLVGHQHSVSNIAWCPAKYAGQELVASSSFDGTARLWDANTGACLQVLADHQKAVYALAFSPDGRCLATGSGDGYVHIYDVKEKEKKWSWFMDTEKAGVFEIDWQQKGKIYRIALALENRMVGIVDVSGISE